MSRNLLLISVLALVGLAVVVVLMQGWGADPSPSEPTAKDAAEADSRNAEAPEDDGALVRSGESPRATERNIVGSVVDGEGKPLSGVALSLSPESETEVDFGRGFQAGRGGSNPGLAALEQQARNWASHTASGEDGSFVLSPGGKAPFRLVARLEGYGTHLRLGVLPGGDALLIVLFPGARIRGLVTASDGKPIPGAKVRLEVGTTYSSADGAFDLGDLPAGQRTLTVSAAAFTTGEIPVELTASETLDVGAIALDVGPGIVGLVLGPDEQPVSGAKVRARQGLADGGIAFTAVDGAFALGDVPPGNWTITAEHGEYGLAALPGIRYAEGQRLTGIVLRMTVPGSISGQVTDVNGEPLAGVGVKAVLASDDAGFESFNRTASTGADGTYRLTGLSAGTYDLSAALSGYVPDRKSGVRVESGQETDTQFALGVGLAVSGRVLDRRGAGVAGAKVSQAAQSMIPMPGQPAMPSTSADADGNFTLRGITDETVDLTAEKSGYGPATLKGVSAGSGDVDLVLRDLGSISGIVLLEETNQPLAAYEVEAMPAVSQFPGVPGFQAEGDAEYPGGGRFKVTGLKPGTYRVSIYADEFGPARDTAVEVAEGEDTGGLEFKLDPGVVLRGTVVGDADGRPVAGATISADISGNPMFAMMGVGRKKTATSDEEGNFSLPGLPEGTTSIKVSHPEFSDRALANVRLPTTKDLEVRLLIGGTVATKVLTEAGDPVTDVMVILQRQFPFSQLMGTTDATGTVLFERVPPGTYMVMRLDAAGMARKGMAGMDLQMETATVEDGKEIVVEIRERGGVTVRGRVERGGKPVAGTMVYLAGAGQTADAMRNMKFGVSEQDGTFTIEKVTPGEFTVMIMKPGTFTPGFTQKLTVGEDGAAGVLVALPDSSITGYVVSASGKAVGGAQVMIVPERSADFRTGNMQESMQAMAGMTSADGEGRFHLGDIFPGRYVARAWQEGYGGVYSAPFTVDEFTGGPEELRLVLPVGVKVLVRVRLPGGAPVESGWIYVTDQEGNLVPVTIMQAAQTDTTGVVEVRLAPGSYRVEAQAPGHPSAFGEITVTEGATLELDLEVPAAATLTVLVQDAAGKPVEKARVDLLDAAGRSVVRRTTGDFLQDSGDLTMTDKNGKITFPLLSAGTYVVVATKDSARGETTVGVAAGGAREATVELKQ